jgi:Zn-dependent peptidase ImmA (M78 family)
MPSGDVERLEWQANAFAAYLLMPKQEFFDRLARLAVVHKIRNRGHGFLYLDNQSVNYQLIQHVSHDLSENFNVSKKAVRLRLMSLGLLVDATSTSMRVPPISRIVSRRREQ